MHRRTALGALGGSVTAALAGCLGGGDDTGDESGATNGDSDGDRAVITDAFRAESRQGGRIWFGSPDETAFRESDLTLPPSEDIPDPVVVVADLHDDGTWASTSVDFPPISVVAGIEPEVAVPGGLSGEYDEETGRFTLDGDIRATFESGDGTDLTVEFPLSATTGTSGELEGSFERQDGSVSTTIVDNEFTVDDTFGNEFVDTRLNLPSEFEGDNWFELTLDLEPT